MKIQKIDHIAIAVKDMDVGIAFYRDVLKLPYAGREVVGSVETAFFRCGEVLVELVAGVTPDAHVNKHIAKYGEGLYHIAYRVEDIEEALNYCVEKNLPISSSTPQPGANGSKVSFIKARGVFGVLTELVENEDH